MTLFKRALANRIRHEATIPSDESEVSFQADTFAENLNEHENHFDDSMLLSESCNGQLGEITVPDLDALVECTNGVDSICFSNQTKEEPELPLKVSGDVEEKPDFSLALLDVLEVSEHDTAIDDKTRLALVPGDCLASEPSCEEDQIVQQEVQKDDVSEKGGENLDNPEKIAMPIASTSPTVTVETSKSLKIPPTLPKPIECRAGRRTGRVKTRMLGFSQDDEAQDPFSTSSSKGNATTMRKFPVGWCVVTKGPGQGHSFLLHYGVSSIGRSETQAIPLDFGDTSISRENHAAIAYDDEQNGFFLGQSGKSNIIRLNDRPVLSTEALHSGDQIRIGETTLRFVALCDDSFQWGNADVIA